MAESKVEVDVPEDAVDVVEEPASILSTAVDKARTALESARNAIVSSSSAYLSDAVERANSIIEELSKLSSRVKDRVKDVPITELPVVAAIETTARARALVAELSSRAKSVDEKHKISESVRKAIEDARLRTASLFSEASTRLQDLRARISRSTSSGEGSEEAAVSAGTDVRLAVSSMLAAVEDLIHQASEHDRVVGARKALSDGTARASGLVSSATDRAKAAADELRDTLGRIASLPPLTFEELRRLSNEQKEESTADAAKDAAEDAADAAADVADTAADAADAAKGAAESVAEDVGLVSKSRERQLAESIARTLHGVISRSQVAVEQLTTSIHEARSSITTAAAGATEDARNQAKSGSAAALAALERAHRRAMDLLLRAQRHLTEAAGGIQTHASTVATSASSKVTDVATRATDAAIRTAVGVNRRLGVSEKAEALDKKYAVRDRATAVAAKLDEKLSLTQLYAAALSKLHTIDQKLTGGVGTNTVARGRDLAGQGVEYVRGRLEEASTADAPGTDGGAGGGAGGAASASSE